MPEEPREEPREDRRGGAAGRALAWLPAGTFVLGVLLGGLVVGVALDGGDGSRAQGTPSPSPTQASSSAGGTAVVVPDECLAAAQTVRDATALIRDNVSAIRDFRAQKIIDFLNQLEDLDQRAREEANACRDVTVTSTAPSASPAGSSSPTSPSSPTSRAARAARPAEPGPLVERARSGRDQAVRTVGSAGTASRGTPPRPSR